jgi:hypothetical protein
MDPISAFGFEACCATMIGNIAKALAERNGETPEQQFARAQAAAHVIMGFLPRDVIEAMLAGHCVMFHEVMVDSAHITLCAQHGKGRRAELHDLLAVNKAFCGNLGHLQRYQKRPADGSREDSWAAPSGAGPAPQPQADEVVQEQPAPAMTTSAATPAVKDPTVAVQPSPAGTVSPEPPASALARSASVDRPTEEATAACRGNAAAAAALKAGDAAGFARAMGIEQPSPEFLAAANASGSPFDPGSSGPWPESTGADKPKS